MNKHLWYAVNIITGETFEAIEPISFKRFITETGLGNRDTKGFFLGRTKELVLERVQHVKIKR